MTADDMGVALTDTGSYAFLWTREGPVVSFVIVPVPQSTP